MNKCDFCEYSRMKNGKLICPYAICIMTKADLIELAKALSKGEKER